MLKFKRKDPNKHPSGSEWLRFCSLFSWLLWSLGVRFYVVSVLAKTFFFSVVIPCKQKGLHIQMKLYSLIYHILRRIQVLVLFILVKCSEHTRDLFLFYLWALWEIDNIRFMFGTTTLFTLYSVGFAQAWNDGGLITPAHGASFPLDVLGWSCWISSRSATSITHESSSFFDLIPDVFFNAHSCSIKLCAL